MSTIQNTDVRIFRLNARDVTTASDCYRDFSELVLRSEDQYPAINEWLRERVSAEIACGGNRVALIGYAGSEPVVSAVVKPGKHAKFCHLKIDHELRNNNLGEVLFSLMAMQLRHQVSEIHFSLPESLWEERQPFFASFGFRNASIANKQYRNGELELRCSAPFDVVWLSVVEKLPKLSGLFASSGLDLETPLVMSVSSRYALQILSSNKRVEIRKRFSASWQGARSSIYCGSPLYALIGEVTIGRVHRISPAVAWQSYGPVLGCTKPELIRYCGDASEVFAIELYDPIPYETPVPVAQLEQMLAVELHRPQSYLNSERDIKWRSALALTALMHGHFRKWSGRMTAPRELIMQGEARGQRSLFPIRS